MSLVMRNIRFSLVIATLGVLLSNCATQSSGPDASGAAAGADSPRVKIDSGYVRGVMVDGVQAYRGIPYVAPPVGDLRWQKPQPVLPWVGTLTTRDYSPFCPQLDSEFLWFELTEMSEDCVTLNVLTTAAKTGDKLPVMVWIHGGGYVNGSGNIERLNSAAMAKEGVVLVTINYRLAMFGFMTHPALASGDPENPQGNYGLLDIIESLDWVQRNIAGFGGDPDNVTIFGESAGAGLVNFLMVTPESKGLFHKAISQSSSVGIAPDPYIDRRAGFLPSSNSAGIGYAKRLNLTVAGPVEPGIDGQPAPQPQPIEDPAAATPEVAAALRAVSTEDFMRVMKPSDRFTPVVDGVVIPDQVGELLSKRQQHTVPYITGGNSWEASLGRAIGGGFSPEFAGKLVAAADKERLYPGLQGEALDDQIFGDLIVHSASRYFAQQMYAMDQPVYRYYLSYIAEARRDTQPGAAHTDDIAFVMQTLDSEADLELVSADDRRISSLMSDYWVQFAKTGNPNGPGLPDWLPWEPTNRVVLEIGDNIVIREKPFEDRMQLHIRRAQGLVVKARKQ
jgi:para-nitrobenzyl esterase